MAGVVDGRPAWDQWEDMGRVGHASAAALWARTDLRPADVDVAQLYDGFTIEAIWWLEAMGFCGTGEAGAFIDGGTRIALDGELPLNTWGGQLSGGRLHAAFGHTAEAVRQLRGEAGARQVAGAEVAAVTNVGGIEAGAALADALVRSGVSQEQRREPWWNVPAGWTARSRSSRVRGRRPAPESAPGRRPRWHWHARAPASCWSTAMPSAPNRPWR